MTTRHEPSTDALLRDALRQAAAISWDGCHKICVLMDEGSVAVAEEAEHRAADRIVHLNHHDNRPNRHLDGTVDEKAEAALAIVRKWFDESCSLRFIERVVENTVVNDLVPQGEDWA